MPIKRIWRVLKLETLVWAHMYDDTVHYSDNNPATLALPHARSLKVEPEIVFGLKEPGHCGTQFRMQPVRSHSVDWLGGGI